MNQKPTGRALSSEQIIRDIKRKTRKQYNVEEKIRIVLDGLRGEDSIAELCRREGIAQSLYYKGSKDFVLTSTRNRSMTAQPREYAVSAMPLLNPNLGQLRI